MHKLLLFFPLDRRKFSCCYRSRFHCQVDSYEQYGVTFQSDSTYYQNTSTVFFSEDMGNYIAENYYISVFIYHLLFVIQTLKSI